MIQSFCYTFGRSGVAPPLRYPRAWQQRAVLRRPRGDAMMANTESSASMDARIILVEGFPGCGKSTTAQWLARQLRAAGRSAEWFYEQQRPHPMAGETPTPASSWQDYFAARLARWSRLSQRVRSSGTVSILESAWLQGPVFLMLHRDLDRRLIKAFILKTVEAMRGADPALIYLPQPDPSRRDAFRPARTVVGAGARRPQRRLRVCPEPRRLRHRRAA
jgi:hypothetical protein